MMTEILTLSFGTDGVAHLSDIGFIESLVLQEDGKMMVGGYFDMKAAIARLNSDGTIDESFGESGYVITEIYNGDNPFPSDSFIFDLAIQDDGKIVATGFCSGATSYSDIIAYRFLSDGTLDSDFADEGLFRIDFGLADFCTTVTIQPDGKIVLGCHKEIDFITGVPEYEAIVIRLNTDGSPDNTFGIDGIAAHRLVTEATYIEDLTIQDDGKIVFTGNVVTDLSNTYDTYVCRLEANGDMDLTFAETGYKIIDPDGGDDYSTSVQILYNGDIVVGGYSSDQDFLYRFRVMKLLGNWKLETPAVNVEIDNVTPFSLDATFTRNSTCASYYFMIATTESMQLSISMMGSASNALKMFGINKEEDYTHEYKQLDPDTEYFMYTLCLDENLTEFPYDSTACPTLPLGGAGEAKATIELFDITLNSVRMVVTPNAATAQFHDGLITKSYFDEIGEEAALEYFQTETEPLYKTDDWIWPDLDENTKYVAIATCKNGQGEWGTPTIVEFTTTPVSVSGMDEGALIIYPNPNHGIFQIVGENLQGAEVKVFDTSGRQTYGQLMSGDRLSVDISDRENGLYVIQIIHNGEVTTHKILKQ